MPSSFSAEHDGLLTPSSDDATVLDDFPSDDQVSEDNDVKQPSSPEPATTSKGMLEPPGNATQAQQPVVLTPYVVVTMSNDKSNNKREARTAWGRTGISKLGYHGFAKMVFDAYILHPSRAPKWEFSLFEKSDRAVFWEVYKHLQADFVARVKFRPQFASRSSALDGSVDEAISLQTVGLPEMVQNLVSIRVDYQVPDTYPGKTEVERILKRAPKET